MHTAPLLEALDGELDALSERLVFVIHPVLFFGLRRCEGCLDIGLFEARWLLHVLGRAIRIYLLLLWLKRDWVHGGLASTRIKGDVVFHLAEVLVK